MVTKIIKNKVYIISVSFLSFSCTKNNQREIVLKDNVNNKNTITFIYKNTKIEEVLTTYEDGKRYISKNYYVKKNDGYYEDVDLVDNDKVTDFRRVLVKHNVNYTYQIPIHPPSFDGIVKVKIKRLEPNSYMYSSISGSRGTKLYFDEKFKINRVVRILSAKDSIVYE